MPRTPQPSNFPPSLQSSLFITPPSSGSPRSLLILLHGLGDNAHPFSNLGRQLNLPSTATLSLRAPNPLPAFFLGEDLGGASGEASAWHWGDDILVDQRTGGIDCEGGGFTSTSKVLGETLKVVLAKEGEEPLAGCGFEPRDVFFLGFGQGGMVALAFAELWRGELGGVLDIGGALPTSKTSMAKAVDILGSLIPSSPSGKAKTPILLCGGTRCSAVTSSALSEVKNRFENVQYVKWARDGDGMPRNREEMLPLMKFLAQRLRMATPGGMDEIGGV